MAVQLGLQVPRPARGFPRIAFGGDVGIVEQDFQRGIAEHGIEPIQRLLDQRIQDHQQHVRRRRAHIVLGRRRRIEQGGNLRAGLHDRGLSAVARSPRARQHDHALAVHSS